MPQATFDAFVAACRETPALALRRFSLLCTQGAPAARELARQLQAGAPRQAPEVLLAGLEVLGSLDVRSAIQRYSGPQLHLLAGADALVPAGVAADLLALQPDIEVGLAEAASHALALERPHELAAVIDAFLTEAGDV
jgi:pimeloyl-[acyl-carrier protein] methyl ester esterase